VICKVNLTHAQYELLSDMIPEAKKAGRLTWHFI